MEQQPSRMQTTSNHSSCMNSRTFFRQPAVWPAKLDPSEARAAELGLRGGGLWGLLLAPANSSCSAAYSWWASRRASVGNCSPQVVHQTLDLPPVRASAARTRGLVQCLEFMGSSAVGGASGEQASI